MRGDGPCLMGRDWLKHIRLNWKEIRIAMLDTTQSRLKSLLQSIVGDHELHSSRAASKSGRIATFASTSICTVCAKGSRGERDTPTRGSRNPKEGQPLRVGCADCSCT